MTFAIDNENHITVFGSAEEAAAATTTLFDSFASQKELAELLAGWPAERLVAVWNSLPGVEPAKGFKNAKAAASRLPEPTDCGRPPGVSLSRLSLWSLIRIYLRPFWQGCGAFLSCW